MIMATEYQLKYTAKEIEEKLGIFDNLNKNETDIIPYQELLPTEEHFIDVFFGIDIVPSPSALELGKTYMVEWDGKLYECSALDVSILADGVVGLGNGESFGLSGNNEPFMIGIFNNLEAAMFVSLTDTQPTVHTVRIYTRDNSDKVLQLVNGELKAVPIGESSVATYIENYIKEALGGDY